MLFVPIQVLYQMWDPFPMWDSFQTENVVGLGGIGSVEPEPACGALVGHAAGEELTVEVEVEGWELAVGGAEGQQLLESEGFGGVVGGEGEVPTCHDVL